MSVVSCLQNHYSIEDLKWAWKNVSMPDDATYYNSMIQVRFAFWQRWMHWQECGYVMVVDCPYPVESRFLNECIKDNTAKNENYSPYPLIDVGSALFQAGYNPTANYKRMENELPAHNPLCDARHSLRLLLDLRTLDKVPGDPYKPEDYSPD